MFSSFHRHCSAIHAYIEGTAYSTCTRIMVVKVFLVAVACVRYNVGSFKDKKLRTKLAELTFILGGLLVWHVYYLDVYVILYFFLSATYYLRPGSVELIRYSLKVRTDDTGYPTRYRTRHFFNSLKPELNPICYLLALLGTHHFLHVSRIRVKLLTFRLLMS